MINNTILSKMEIEGRPINTFSLILSVFPFPVKILGISSLLPQQIIERVSAVPMDKEQALVLHNGDIWRYGDDFLLQKFLSELGIPVFIFTLGYKNQIRSSTVFEVSWPEWYLIRPPMPDVQIKNPGLEYGFGCLNNTPSLQRLLLGWQLDQQGLLSEMVFSQNFSEYQIHGFDQVIIDSLPGFETYRQKLPIRWHRETEINFRDKLHYLIPHDAYDNCYAYIITESEFESFYWPGVAVNNPTNSEKSYKPLAGCQIPIFLAARGHVAYTNSLGFECMEDLLPPGYDHMGTFGKIQAICQTVAKGKDWIEQQYHERRREILHNAELVRTQEVDRKVVMDAKNFVESCLQ